MRSVLPFEILVITDTVVCRQAGRTVEATVGQLLQSPYSHRMAILVRDKLAALDQIADTLQTLNPLAKEAGARLLVHTHTDLALAFNLDGVHVASQVALGTVRSQLRPGMLLGASRHGSDPLDADDLGEADYATLSPLFRPTSKPADLREPLGLLGLQACAARAVRPLVALGGIKPGRAAGAIAHGAAAIAISGALLQADSPATVLDQLCLELDAQG
ncbi:MAG: thiamine phosphate synthase [Thermosynechococcaceae cyanobacterium]